MSVREMKYTKSLLLIFYDINDKIPKTLTYLTLSSCRAGLLYFKECIVL